MKQTNRDYNFIYIDKLEVCLFVYMFDHNLEKLQKLFNLLFSNSIKYLLTRFEKLKKLRINSYL